MKRIYSLSLLLLSLLAFTSCGEKESSASSGIPSFPVASDSENNNSPVVSTSDSSITELSEVLENGNLAWDKKGETKVAKGREEDFSFVAVDGISFSLKNAFGVTDAKVTVTSSKESVIPSGAITYNLKTSGTSNVLLGGNVQFDLKAVSLGTAYITLNFVSTTGSSAKGTIVKKVEVVSFGEVSTIHYSQTVKFDYSSVSGSLWTSFSKGKVQYSFDAPYGSDIYEEATKQYAVDTENRTMSVTFSAIPEVPVYLSASYTKDEEGHIQHLAIEQPGGSTLKKTGYTITKDTYNQAAILTFGSATVTSAITVKILNKTA